MTVFVIPETCDSIGDRAFAHTIRLAVSSWGYWTYGELKCKAKNPPKLGEDVFVDTDFLELGVPFGSEELYRNAYGWKKFKHIYGTDVFINGIKAPKDRSDVSLTDCGTHYRLCSRNVMSRVEYYSVGGSKDMEETVNSTEVAIMRANLCRPFTVLRICFANGTSETVKLTR